jgi:hypothetical protein
MLPAPPRRLVDTADFWARIAFFAVVPFVVLVAAALFPIGMTIVNLLVCVAAVVFASVIRAASRRYPVLERLLGGAMKFERYYRLHPPKPFVYYIFFPLFFPYWLASDAARREFVLYKAVNLASLAFVLLGGVYQYFAYYRPELGIGACARVLLLTLVVEIALVMVMLMPLATSIVRYRLAGQRDRLVTLLAVGGLSTTLSAAGLMARRDPIVSWAARERLVLRTEANAAGARDAQRAGAGAALAAIRKHRGGVDRDGKIGGEPLEKARKALATFYKADEAQAFDLWLTRSRRREVLVLYVESNGSRRPAVFYARDRAGRELRDAKQLPRGALRAMRVASDGVSLDL